MNATVRYLSEKCGSYVKQEKFHKGHGSRGGFADQLSGAVPRGHGICLAHWSIDAELVEPLLTASFRRDELLLLEKDKKTLPEGTRKFNPLIAGK